MQHDPIADMIIRLKNAGLAGKDSVSFPYSKMKLSIAELLSKEGYVGEVETKGKKMPKLISIKVSYSDGVPRIRGVERVSRFSRRIYSKSKELKPVLRGFGLSVLTTPGGIMTDKEAKQKNLGGEMLFKIW